MGVYILEELIRKWARGELTVEQAIGQILLIIQTLEGRISKVEGKEGTR
ncbi:MAG: hypothetical protein ACE5NP_05200 [Anaerolineae bacterium]